MIHTRFTRRVFLKTAGVMTAMTAVCPNIPDRPLWGRHGSIDVTRFCDRNFCRHIRK